jgi:sulfide:quinone oxidoreductase
MLVEDSPVANTQHHQILTIGGGTAGITVAASLRRRGSRSLDIAIVEPSETHYYQPCLTLVGAGAYDIAKAQRPEQSLIPAGVTLIRGAAQSFDPDKNSVVLGNGDTLTYDYLVVCTGVKLDWGKIDGLPAALGKNGVCSNYSPLYAPYTWQCVQGLKSGSRVVFTQPPLPFKCPGAPQKIVYLTADRLRRAGTLQACDLQYFVHAPVVFGVPFFARELMKVVTRYGIKAHFQQNLVAVDGAAKTATFEAVGEADKGKRVTIPFDMLHISPPQSPPDAIAKSPLANSSGWVEVNQNSMQHVRYPNVFSLGDVSSAPNSKTAAAVRKQAPIVVRNLLHMIAGTSVEAGYDGYASCPLTTAYGKVAKSRRHYPSIRRRRGGSAGGSRLPDCRSSIGTTCSKAMNVSPGIIRRSRATPPELAIRAKLVSSSLRLTSSRLGGVRFEDYSAAAISGAMPGGLSGARCRENR